MHNMLKAHSPIRHVKSLRYAFTGLVHVLINEANFRVQLCITAAVVYLGLRFGINYLEWGLLVISLGMLLIAEMINTIVENFIDVLIKEYHEGAKIIKDVSAGFVFVTSLVALFNIVAILGRPLITLFL